jgi:hypothetical protein
MTLRAAPDGAAFLICASPQNVRTRKVRRRASTRLIRSDRRSAPPSANLPACHSDRHRRDSPAMASWVLLVLRICAGGSNWAGRDPHLAAAPAITISQSCRDESFSDPISLSTSMVSKWTRFPRSYNGAPSQEMLVIRRHKTVERTLEPLFRGLICRCQDKKGGALTIQCRSR